MSRRAFFAAAICLAAVSPLFARPPRHAQAPAAPAAEQPAARTEDVKSLEAIVAAVYDTISGPAGERDWNRFRSLFVPDARLIPVVKSPDGSFAHRSLSVEQYIGRAREHFLKNGFFEHGVAQRTEQFGQIAHVFTTYDSRESADGKPFARGINSMQFFNDGKRWWCVTIFWDSERPDNPIPDRYLPK